MPKNGFPMPTTKNGFHILNLHPKKYVLKIPFFNANLLEKFKIFILIKEGIIKKISYDRRNYESVDENSLS